MSEPGGGEHQSPGWRKIVNRVTSKLSRSGSSVNTGIPSPREAHHTNLSPHENLTPEAITPHEALTKIVAKHDEYALQKMQGNEYGPAAGVIQSLQGNADTIVNATEYNESAIPPVMNWSMSDIGAGFLTVRAGKTIHSRTPIPEGVQPFMVSNYVDPSELHKIEYNFGQQALSQQDCRQLIGDSFDVEAQAAIAKITGNYKEADLQKEIQPGITLHIHVVDDNNPYGEAPGQESNYRVTTSFATIQLAGESPLTGRTLIQNTIDQYRQDFRKRYEDITAGSADKGSFTGETPVEEVVARIVVLSDDEAKAVLPPGDSLEILADRSAIIPELRMYLLAKMKYGLSEAGKEIPQMQGVSLDDQIAKVVPLYRKFREELRDQTHRGNLELLRKIMNREPVVPLTEQEREEIIQRNLELLEHSLVKRTPYWELDDETNKALRGLGGGETRHIPESNGTETSLKVMYETKSGRITPIPNDQEFLPGDYSRLQTWLTNVGRKIEPEKEGDKIARWVMTETGTNTIALTQPGEGPTMSQIDEAITGDDSNAPEEANRRLLPERIDPREDYRTYMGQRVQWGEAVWNEPIEGDSILLRSIQLFNQKFGPQR